MRIIILGAALLAGVAVAAPPRAALPPVRDAVLKGSLKPGQQIAGRIDGDLDGDGAPDTVYVVESDEARAIHVLLAARPARRAAGTLRLDPQTLGPASLSIGRGVLRIEDLSGGTTAVSTIYRYRLDPRVRRMRLIGLDATFYSRTYAHDGAEMSWNLLTGAAITRDLRLNRGGGDAAYDSVAERRLRRPSKPLYMENTPDPEAVITALRAR